MTCHNVWHFKGVTDARSWRCHMHQWSRAKRANWPFSPDGTDDTDQSRASVSSCIWEMEDSTFFQVWDTALWCSISKRCVWLHVSQKKDSPSVLNSSHMMGESWWLVGGKWQEINLGVTDASNRDMDIRDVHFMQDYHSIIQTAVQKHKMLHVWHIKLG